MSDQYFSHEVWLSKLRDHLEEERYAARTSQRCLVVARRFLASIEKQHVEIGAVGPTNVERYLEHAQRGYRQRHGHPPDYRGWRPVQTVRDGIRDRAMLHLCFAGGLRVSELVGLRIEDMMLQPQASVLIHGKGRKERCLPLWKETASAVRAWLSVRGEVRVPELFPNARNDAMTRAGFEYILRKHVHTAETRCSTLASKHVSPHVLRHTCALTILQATKDLRKVSLWLGHSSMQTTEIYTRADPSVKLEALESVIAPKLRTGRFKATDKLIEMLKAAPNMRSKKTAK